jgi:hypothetical protein
VRLEPYGTLFLGPALNEDVNAATRRPGDVDMQFLSLGSL